MASKQKESGNRKRVNLCEKFELIKKLESEATVVRVCGKFEVKKQTITEIRRSKDKLTSHSMKFDVAPSKDRSGCFHK